MNDRDLSLLSLANYIIGIILKGTPEGVSLPRGGDHAENGSFSIFHAVSSM